MMKTIAVILAAVYLAHFGAEASVKPITCPGGPSSKCVAVAGLNIRSTSGSCTGSVTANCKVWTQSETVYKNEFQTIYSNPDLLCDSVFIEARAKAVARAIAQVWAGTLVDIKCTGDSFGCGFAFAGGEGFALSVAEAVAVAAADASAAIGNDVVEVFCFADIRALAAGFATASTTAFSRTCTAVGGSAKVFEDNFVSAIQTVVAKALASALAERCIEPGVDNNADTQCKGKTDIAQSGTIVGVGKFCAGVGAVEICEGVPGAQCCGKPSPICAFPNCPGCFLPWNRNPATKIWTKANGKKCICP